MSSLQKKGDGRRLLEESMVHFLPDDVGVIDMNEPFATNFVSESSPVTVELNLTHLDPYTDTRPFWKRLFDTKWRKARRIENFHRNMDLARKQMGIKPLVIEHSFTS